MNLAIKGSKDFKKDVINILISLGGTNKDNITGNLEDYVYYIDFDDQNNTIRSRRDTTGYIVFTVEEFYIKYPFKPEEEVTYFNNLHTIERLSWNTVDNTLRVVLDGGVRALPTDVNKVNESGVLKKAIDPFQPGFDVYWNGKLCYIVSINEEGLGDGDPIYRVSPYDDPIGETYGALRENLLPPDLDSECVELVTYLNNVAGVVTYGSCCGHLESNYFVLFRCSDHEKLARLSRSVNRNYSDGKWLIELTDTDGAPCCNYILRSKEPFVTLDEMRESVSSLVDNICHWSSSEFDSYFKTNGNEDSCVINLNHYKNPEVELVLGNREIIERNGKTYVAIKKPKYPKNYKECCDVLGLNTLENDASGYKHELIIRFQELIIARDAYWKIAGVERGLNEPWQPDFVNKAYIHVIRNCGGEVIKDSDFYADNFIFAFPTVEMRDIFLENFITNLEYCKELL